LQNGVGSRSRMLCITSLEIRVSSAERVWKILRKKLRENCEIQSFFSLEPNFAHFLFLVHDFLATRCNFSMNPIIN
jgi:hypothetical protein